MEFKAIFIGSEGDFSASDKRKLSALARKVFRDVRKLLEMSGMHSY